MSLKAQNKRAPERPKLVLGIVVEGMRPDYLMRFRENFGSGGFNRLLTEGRQYINAEYDYLYPESASAYATIMTGANPSIHGIVANSWYNRLKKKEEYCVEDLRYKGLGTSRIETGRSPGHLLCSTVGDELRLSNFRQSKVISISLKDYAAVLGAGHSGNGAFWYDTAEGKWVSANYYFPELPYWVKRFNEKNLSEIYLSKTWDTFFSLTQYNSLGDDNRYEKGFTGSGHVFPYSMPEIRYKNNHYELLHYTPFGNSMVRELAMSALVNEKLGKDKHPDFLMISFTANAGVAEKFGLRSVEIEDAYIRLDQEIETLLDFVDDYVGLENVLVFLTADKGAEDAPAFIEDIGLPTRNFNRKGAKMLTKSYLKALYEKNLLIERFDQYGIYFDVSVLDKAQISADEIQNKTADFLIDFTGVSATYSAARIESGNFQSGKYAAAQKQFLRKRSPDVLIEFEAGTIDEDGTFTESGNRNYLNVPLVFYGWKVKAGKSAERISLIDLAPAVSAALGISYPNASTGNPPADLF